jgi:arsenite methyltransferase
MKNLKAEMLNRKASDPKNKPDQILKALALQTGQTVADIGAGGGYFSLRFADSVGREGRVFAVDTDPSFLEFIKSNAKEKGLDSVEAVLATENELHLPKGSLDLVFMRNVTHHLPNRVDYFRKLKDMLKPEGRIAIIEYRHGGGFSFHRMFGHFVPEEVIVAEMNKVGYQLKENFDFLPEQSFAIFSIRNENKRKSAGVGLEPIREWTGRDLNPRLPPCEGGVRTRLNHRPLLSSLTRTARRLN